MATRRIARGRGASPVPIIVLSVLLVGLLASTIILALKIGAIELDAEKAKEEVRKSVGVRRADLEREAGFERLVGLKVQGAADQLARLKNELQAKAPLKKADGEEVKLPPFDDLVSVANVYAERLAVSEANETYLKDNLDKSKVERDRLIQDVKAKEAEGQKMVADEKKRGDEIDEAKKKVEADLAAVRKELATAIETEKNEKVEFTKEINSAKKEIEILKKKIKEWDKKYTDYVEAKKIGPLVPQTSGPGAAGRIVSVDADAQHVMIDIGRRDWVEVGMEFKVFDQADPVGRKEKGQIQVRRVFDAIAQAKVLKQDPVDPILPGMVVVNPAFSRGKTLEFVFEGRLNDPNLERSLSRYPCRVAKIVTDKTDYLILGEADRKATDPNPEDSENKKLVDTKYKNSCVVMRERELARYLGELE